MTAYTHVYRIDTMTCRHCGARREDVVDGLVDKLCQENRPMKTIDLSFVTPEGGPRKATVPIIDARLDGDDMISALALTIIALNDQLVALRERVVTLETGVPHLFGQLHAEVQGLKQGVFVDADLSDDESPFDTDNLAVMDAAYQAAEQIAFNAAELLRDSTGAIYRSGEDLVVPSAWAASSVDPTAEKVEGEHDGDFAAPI